MSTGNLGLDAILNTVKEDYLGDTDDSLAMIKKRYPKLSEKEAEEIFLLLKSNCEDSRKEKSSLVVTAPPSFRIKSVSTKTAVRDILEHAKKSILITGYSLSDYFADSNDVIIRKSQSGVFTRFFINKIDEQTNVEKLLRYKGKFLRIYNYPESEEDKMAALHAKVISVDSEITLITSANLSYHGQQGNIEMGFLIESKQIATEVEEVKKTAPKKTRK